MTVSSLQVKLASQSRLQDSTPLLCGVQQVALALTSCLAAPWRWEVGRSTDQSCEAKLVCE